MSALVSDLFRGDKRLEKCLTDDSAHVVRGDKGTFVAFIQYAILVLEGGSISGIEIEQMLYGPDTARVVLAYKKRRNIINLAYQKVADDIVGKMTIRSLDTEMARFEAIERMQLLASRR